MKNFNWLPVWEAAKEPLRLLLLAVIPFAISYLTEISWEYAGLALLILRFIDKYLHELGKEEENESLTLGLTRF